MALPEEESWSEVARALLPGGDVLTLRRRGDGFEIRINLLELMASRNPASERVLAEVACARIGRRAARVLIGGLGMGYTLRAALDHLGRDARITVAELVPQVVAWNRGPLADLAARPLDDPRVTVHTGDVADAIRANPCAFDAILMDVDNGPESVCFESNRFLYSVDGARLILSGLKPRGVLALWAADPSPDFERAVETAGSRFERLEVAVPHNDSRAHTIYLVGAGSGS